MKINKKFITKNRYRLVKLQNNINNLLKRFGLDIRFDLNYHGSYLVGGESLFYRKNLKTGKQDAEILRKLIDKDSIVLDIGCGCGRVEKFLAEYCKEIHGIDISSRAIRIAKKFVNKPNAFFYTTDNLSIFNDKMFDLVFEIATFHHMSREDFYCYLLEVYKVLKNKGIFFFIFNHITNNSNFEYFVYNSLIRNKSCLRMRFYTGKEIKFILEKIGFRNIKIEVWKNRWKNNCVKKVIAKKRC